MSNLIMGFMKKFFTTKVIENIVGTLLKELVKRTDSKIDDKIYNIVFLFYLYFSISLSALSSPKALALLRASRALSFCFISPKAMPRMMKMSGS